MSASALKIAIFSELRPHATDTDLSIFIPSRKIRDGAFVE